MQLDGVKDNNGIEIWFTEDLSAGLVSIVNGAILELKTHLYHYTATNIKFQTFDPMYVALPREGTKATIAEEEKLIEKAVQ